MREILRMSAIVNNKPEFLHEYERLLKQWERSQKEAMSRPSKVDPLAEFERLFKLWQRTQNKIRQQTYWQEVEDKFKKVYSEEMSRYEQEMKERERLK